MMKEDGSACIPPFQVETERPIPTLSPAVKQAVTVINRMGSANVCGTLLVLMLLFLFPCQWDELRLLQLGEEFALLAGYSLLLADHTGAAGRCVAVSVATHWAFTAAHSYYLLEAVHTYSLVAAVVPSSGLLSRRQNFFLGIAMSVGSVENC